MPLSDFISEPVRIRGGIRKIELLDAGDLERVINNGGDSFQLYSRNGWTGFDFEEDTATYTETVSGDTFPAPVLHTLRFRIRGTGAQTRTALNNLLNTPRGVLAAVTTADCGVLLLGYSSAMRAQFPLRLVRCTTESGLAPLDFCGSTVTLQSTDCSTAARATILR